MLADLPEVDGRTDVDERLLHVPQARDMRLSLLRHDLHQVDIAHLDTNGANHAEAQVEEDHDTVARCDHQARVQEQVNEHAEPEDFAPALLVSHAWEPEQCDAPA